MSRRGIVGITIFGISLMFGGQLVAQQTSTQEERTEWVEVAHKLEAEPLDSSASARGEQALKRLMEVHDLQVALCPMLFSEFNGSKYGGLAQVWPA